MAVWRDISLLWLVFLTLVAVLPFGVLSVLAIRGLHRLRTLMKWYLPLIQDKAEGIAINTERATQKITGPIIGAHARAAQIRGFTRAIWTRRMNP